MVKIRSLREALAYIKTLDADTGISENAIRRLVVFGKVPSVKIGKKYLVNVDMLVSYFEDRLSVGETEKIELEVKETGDDIHPIPEQLKPRKAIRF